MRFIVLIRVLITTGVSQVQTIDAFISRKCLTFKTTTNGHHSLSSLPKSENDDSVSDSQEKIQRYDEQQQQQCHHRLSVSRQNNRSNRNRNNSNNENNNNRRKSSWTNRKYKRKLYHDTTTTNVLAATESLRNQQKWLQQATQDIISTKLGTLVHGKCHELVSILKAWSKYAKIDPQTPILMERLIQRLIDEQQQQQQVIQQNHHQDAFNNNIVDIEIYNRLLDAWCCVAFFQKHNRNFNNSPQTASQRARQILVLLQENYEAPLRKQQQGPPPSQPSLLEQNYPIHQPPQPNQESFSMVYDVVLKVEGTTIARRLLAWMEYIYKMKRNDFAKPTKSYYYRLLNEYANQGQGPLAESLLRHMMMMNHNNNNHVHENNHNSMETVLVDTCCWNICIKAYTTTTTNNNNNKNSKRGRETAEHADRLLEEMTDPKDIITYSTVISAWSKSGMKSHAVARAEQLLREIEETPNLQPNTIVLNTIMSTWVKSKNPGSVDRTKELLTYMQSSSTTPPDLISYNTHLHALCTHAGMIQHSGYYAQRAHDLLLYMEEQWQNGTITFHPNLFSYNCVIEAWTQSTLHDPDAAWKAVQVLQKLIHHHHNNNNHHHHHYELRPDAFSFNQVLFALSKCSTKHKTRSSSSSLAAAQLAQELLDTMEREYNLFDIVSYSSVITCLARSKANDAAQRGERLLQRVKSHYASGKSWMRPTNVLYNAVIDLWAKSGKGTLGARKAEALLKEMDQVWASPNTITYNSVIQSWAISGTRCCGNKAEEYLDRMWDLYQADGQIKPNDVTFLAVINAVSKSQNKGKAQRALRILRRMDKLYRNGYKFARPNAYTYTSVLNAAAFPPMWTDARMKRKAMDTATFTLQELRASRYDHPNEVTYSTFLKVSSNLLSEDSEMLRDVIVETFEQCKRDGQVGEKFLYRLRKAAPDDLYKELLSEAFTSEKDIVGVEDLPPSWSSKLRKQRQRIT